MGYTSNYYNYKKLLNNMQNVAIYYSSGNAVRYSFSELGFVKDPNDTNSDREYVNYRSSNYSYLTYYNFVPFYNDRNRIRVGSSDAIESINDYTYELIDNLSYSSITLASYSDNYNTNHISLTCIVTNNNENDVIIKEVCFLKVFHYDPNVSSSQASFYPSSQVLMARKVLNKPITVPAGQQILVVMDFSEELN